MVAGSGGLTRGLTRVPGLLAAHWTSSAGTTGCTVLLFPEGARAGVAVPGHAPGSRELGVLDPTHLAGAIHGLVLTGGSAHGLAVADGVMGVLEERGIGFETGAGVVPLVPAAVLFDLGRGPDRPDAASGRAAASAASREVLDEGLVGAGAGARVGKAAGLMVPGGFGTASCGVGKWIVAAGAAVNALGSIRDPETGAWIAGGPPVGEAALTGDWRGHTTLVAVATDAPLDRVSCTVVARMATAGLARTIVPAFTPFDGDTVYCVATGQGSAPDALGVSALGHAAAEVVASAVLRGVQASAASIAAASSSTE